MWAYLAWDGNGGGKPFGRKGDSHRRLEPSSCPPIIEALAKRDRSRRPFFSAGLYLIRQLDTQVLPLAAIILLPAELQMIEFQVPLPMPTWATQVLPESLEV